jgi:hypothetical protein
MLALAQKTPGQTRPPDNIFVSAPAVVTPPRRPRPLESKLESPPAQSKMDTSKTDGATQQEEPNVWIPRKLEIERANHPMSKAQGKTHRRSLMQPQPRAQGHRFFLTLNEWATKGVPVDCGPNWEWEIVEQAVARGPHCSSMEKENIALVHEDIQYQVDAGFLRIMLWSELQKVRQDHTHGRRPSEELAGPPNTRSVLPGVPGEDTIQMTSVTLGRGSKLGHTATCTQWASQRNRQHLSSNLVPIGRRRSRQDRHAIQDRPLGRILANDCGPRGSLELLLRPARSSWPLHTCRCPIGTPNGLG